MKKFLLLSFFFVLSTLYFPSFAQGPCSGSTPWGCQCPDGISTDCDLLPDMTASRQGILDDLTEAPGNIFMGNATPNIGWGPLEIHGIQSCYCDGLPVSCTVDTCPGTYSIPTQDVNQRVYHRSGNTMTSYDRPAGTMSYHPGHFHTHVDNWAYFTMRRETPNPDATTWPIIGTGTKVSFCLVNLGDCDYNPGYCVDNMGTILAKTDIPNYDFGTVTGCNIDQGIYPGNLDIYSSGLNDMGIILDPGTCNGDYFIVSITDPNNNFLESDETNNWVAVPIHLSLQAPGTFENAGFTFSSSGTFANFNANALTADSCVWIWGDGSNPTTSFTPNTTHIFPGAGFYIVQLTAYNHCGPTPSNNSVHIIASGISEQDESVVAFDLHPNPTNSKTKITYTLAGESTVALEVFDALGNRIRSMVNNNQLAGNYEVMFDTKADHLSSGIYFIRLTSGNKVLMKRLVVMQ
jgi:PKD repeat protein